METISEQNKYRLYALKAGDMPSEAEFYFLLPEIDLVYTREAPPNAVEIVNPEQIPADARAWLSDCLNEISERWLRDTAAPVLADEDFLRRLREELETEAREAREHGNADETDRRLREL